MLSENVSNASLKCCIFTRAVLSWGWGQSPLPSGDFLIPNGLKRLKKIVKKIWHCTCLHHTRICQILCNVYSKNLPNVSFLAFPQERLILETWGWSQSIGNSILHQNTSFFNFGKVNFGCNSPANERKMQIFGVPRPPS